MGVLSPVGNVLWMVACHHTATQAAPGGAVAASVLLPGVLAPSRLRIESGHERLLPMGPADAPYLVALFTCPLDVLAATEDQAPRPLGPAASIDMLSGDTQPEAAQLAALHAAVEALCAAGARVVASQRTSESAILLAVLCVSRTVEQAAPVLQPGHRGP